MPCMRRIANAALLLDPSGSKDCSRTFGPEAIALTSRTGRLSGDPLREPSHLFNASNKATR